jgi:peptidyl-prolyl cis-trans isomerase B (cyclophilin B)
MSLNRHLVLILCLLTLGWSARAETETASADTPDLTTEEITPAAEIVAEPQEGTAPVVIIKTSKGDITVKLDAENAPLTVENFLAYVDSGHYANTIFHRVIPNFMIQGGGFTPDMNQKPTRAPVKNEAQNGLKNKRGTLAMARTQVIDSATSQFFINVVDNEFLNFRAPNPAGFGYCVFGEVTEGMEVVDAIRAVPTGRSGPHSDVPVEPVIITEIMRASQGND